MERATDWKDFLPSLIVLLLAIVTPYFLPSGLREVSPPLAFSVIFYFLRHRVRPLISIWIILLSGFFLDIHQAMPIGIGVSAAILLYWLSRLRDERKEHPAFLHNYLNFILVSAVIAGWIYMIMSLSQGQLYPLSAVIMQWVVWVLSYPLIYGLCHAIHQQINRHSSRSL